MSLSDVRYILLPHYNPPITFTFIGNPTFKEGVEE